MEISLVRHGKSKWEQNNRITYIEFEDWVTKYDEHGVYPEESYSVETQKKLAAAMVIYTSNLFRSIESSQLLTKVTDVISNPLYREIELPKLSGALWNVKLKPNVWAVLLRCLWFAGYSRDCESLRGAKIRARQAAAELVREARKSQSVVLVGHGFFNILIAKELLHMGWTGAKRPAVKHWQVTTYTFKVEYGQK